MRVTSLVGGPRPSPNGFQSSGAGRLSGPASGGAASQPSVLVVDAGQPAAVAMIVTERGAWVVPDPNGAGHWPGVLRWDGPAAGPGSPAGGPGPEYGAGSPATPGGPSSAGWRLLRPGDLLPEFFATVRNAAGLVLAAPGGPPVPLDRLVVTLPASAAGTDALRRHLVGAAQAAGFTAVELLPGPALAVWAPGPPVRMGDLVLVYDCGVGVEATLIRVTDGLPQILGHSTGADWSAGEPGDSRPEADLALAAGRELLARLGVAPAHVACAFAVGERARAAALAPMIEQGLGLTVAPIDEPELAVARGVAAWLPRSGPRWVLARGSAQRLMPLAYTIPGGTARLLRWLVEPRQPYGEGTAVARVRLASGAVWDLTVRTSGVLDDILVPAGREVHTGEWLALVRPA
jgi:hypothetical protein